MKQHIVNGLSWELKHPQATLESLGYIPEFLTTLDSRPAKEQFHHCYSFGGGWRPFVGFTMRPDGDIEYKGDAPVPLIAETKLRDETIRFYDHAWVAIIQPDGSFEVSRLD